MAKPTFRSDRGNFKKKNESFIDMVQSHMAMDIEIALKTTSGMPVKTGNMKSQTRFFKTKRNNWRTEVDVVYAATQEAGRRTTGKGSPTAVFKNYTTAGTGPGFFMKAIKSIVRNRLQYILEAKRALNL